MSAPGFPTNNKDSRTFSLEGPLPIPPDTIRTACQRIHSRYTATCAMCFLLLQQNLYISFSRVRCSGFDECNCFHHLSVNVGVSYAFLAGLFGVNVLGG